MIQFIAGTLFGIFVCAVIVIVGYCTYIEKKHPKTFAQFRAEMLEAEGDAW